MINEIPVMDMQHHFIPSEALEFVGKTDEYDFSIGLKRLCKAYEIMQNVDLHLSFMDACGIDMAILSTGSLTPNGHKFYQVCNSGYGKVIKEHPDRFRGIIHVYPREGEKNVSEIKRGVEELGLRGLALASSYKDITVDSPIMDHLYETAVQYDIPVFIPLL